MPRPSVHRPYTKSYAIDQIDDIEHLRKVAHRMWEAFYACHSQAVHIIGVLTSDHDCPPCLAYLRTDEGEYCDQARERQRKITDGFGSV